MGDWYTWLKFGHLVGLVLLSGGMATQLIAYAGLLRASTVGELRTWQKLPKERLTDGGMGLLILTGLAMAGQRWSFTDGWILAAIGVLAVTIAAAVAGVGPRTTRLKAALAAAGDDAAAAPAELTAPARDPVLHGAMRLQLVALVEIVYLMARKPSGVGILVSLLVTAVAVVAVYWPLVGGRRAAAWSSPPPAGMAWLRRLLGDWAAQGRTGALLQPRPRRGPDGRRPGGDHRPRPTWPTGSRASRSRWTPRRRGRRSAARCCTPCSSEHWAPPPAAWSATRSSRSSRSPAGATTPSATISSTQPRG